METQFRPYTKIAQLTTTTASSITLADTNDDLTKFNFVSVEGSGGGTSMFAVVLDLGTSTAASTQSTANTMLGDTSGITGGVAKTNGGVVEFLLSDADRVNTILLSQSTTSPVQYFITYGQIQVGNPLRDNERPVGN